MDGARSDCTILCKFVAETLGDPFTGWLPFAFLFKAEFNLVVLGSFFGAGWLKDIGGFCLFIKLILIWWRLGLDGVLIFRQLRRKLVLPDGD